MDWSAGYGFLYPIDTRWAHSVEDDSTIMSSGSREGNIVTRTCCSQTSEVLVEKMKVSRISMAKSKQAIICTHEVED